jgi:hypothetical protein
VTAQTVTDDTVTDETVTGDTALAESAVTRTLLATISETVLTRQVRYLVAICSFAAGLLHVLAMTAHYGHHPTLGRAFLMVGALQIVWAAMLLTPTSRLVVILGALGTAGAMLVWIFSRTKGISWFPGLEHPEPIEWRDVVTQFFQLLALAGAVVMMLPERVHKPAGGRVELAPIAVMVGLAVLTLGVLYVATHDYSHGGGEGTEHTH